MGIKISHIVLTLRIGLKFNIRYNEILSPVLGSNFEFLWKHASLALMIGFYLQKPGSNYINIDFIWTKVHEYVYQVDIINP